MHERGRIGEDDGDGIETDRSLKLRWSARSVPEMKDFDRFPLFIHPIVDKNRRVEEPSYSGEASYRAADQREGLEQIDVIKKRSSEFFTVGGVMIPRPAHEAFKIG